MSIFRGLLASFLIALATLVFAGPAWGQVGQFVKTTLVDDSENPFEVDVAEDGRVFYIERWGDVRVWDPETEDVSTIGHINVYTGQENGLMGLALAPDFAESGQLYLAYSVPPQETLTQRVSRFTLTPQGELDLSSEEVIYEWTHQRDECCHSAGALEFGPDGSLYISTGDNTNPFASNGYTPIDERPGREAWDAQRTSANTANPNGKILRIKPLDEIEPDAEPGIGETYEIPDGNLFADDDPKTLPEIFAMGFRNPFRFKVDPETGWIGMGDYGPDANAADPARGPQGSVEFNVITEPGNFGWPYCIRANTPYIDFQFPDGPSGLPFNCDAPVNDSPNNTGLENLPPAVPATMWMGYSETDPRVPGLGTGGAPMGGPIYHYDPDNPSPTKFPEEFDGKWFIGEWNNNWIKTVSLDEDGEAVEVESFPYLGYRRPMDMTFGPDGSLYLIEWGSNFDGGQAGNADSGVYRIDYVIPTGPQVTVTAEPDRGPAPLEVSFDGEATNPDGTPNPDFTYEWDFGDGSPTSDEEDPTHVYTEPGTYEATLTVTDPDTGEEGSDSVTIRVNQVATCPIGPRSDEFEGDKLDPSRWTIIRPNEVGAPWVADGELHVPIDTGGIYGPNADAANIVVTPVPTDSGEVTVTAKLRVDPFTENYHQAGLRLYSDDDNWASVHMVYVDGGRDIEFIYESNGNPRNGPADKLGGIPAESPYEYYVRLIIDPDNETVRAEYSWDGENWEPVGQPGSLESFDNLMVGPSAVSGGASSMPVAHYDWIRFDPDVTGGGPSDEFDGTTLDKSRWNAIVRENPDTLRLADGKLIITTEPGDLYTGDTDPPPNNIILQSADHAGEDWTIETKLSAPFTDGYSQAGLMAYVDGDNYVKFDAIADVGQGRINRIELRSEVNAAIQDPQPNANVPAGVTDVWLRLTKEGDSYSGEYSLDGENWTAMSAPVANPMESPKFGLFAFGVQQAGDEVEFDYFRVDGQPGGSCGCVIPADEFDGNELDRERWNNIVREDPDRYHLDNGVLWIETAPGDIYGASNSPEVANFILQSPENAGEDWTIETKVIGHNLAGGYAQGGLLAYVDDDNYVKLDLIADEGNSAVNRVELRSEVGGVVQNPQPQFGNLPPDTTDAWLRLTKEGSTYTGAYSFDGENWTTFPDTVQNTMEDPAFGIFTLGVNMPGPEVGFEYFGFEGEAACPALNQPPVIEGLTADPTSGFAPLEVDFSVDASDADGDELTYEWDFGDGGASNQQNPTHTYEEPGTYVAEVTVSDGVAERSRSITIDVLPDDDPSARFRALVFSKTAGFRHDSIPAGHAAIDDLADQHDFQVDHTEDASLFRPEILERYDTVVFLSTTGDVLNEEQQAAFEEYIQGGGGFVGVHAASDTEYDWNWYGHLVGAYFLTHPPGTPTATVVIEDHNHPSTAGQPDSYTKVDEWYNFKSPDFKEVGEADYSPRGDVHVLATVDEESYDEQDGTPGADDHPIIWCQRYDGGRSWYTAMGHTSQSFSEPEFLQQLLGGLETTAGVTPNEDCGVSSDADVKAPQTTAELDPAQPGPGGTYDGPVQVTLTASDGEGTPPEPQTHDVDAVGQLWDPDELEITAGDQVRWNFPEETAGTVHDVWLIPPGGDQSDEFMVVDVQPPGGQSGTYTFDQPGEWIMFCKLHTQFTQSGPQGMWGTVDVKPAPAPPSGVDYIEYRVNTDGETGDWVRVDNESNAEPFVVSFTVEEPGNHVVQFRAADKAGNTEPVRSVSFRIRGDEPCVERSDEFDGDALDTSRWSFQHPTMAATPTVSGGSLQYEIGGGELDEANTGPVAFLGQTIPEGDFELVAKFSGDLTADNTGGNGYAQAGLMLYQTDNNFVKVTHTRVGVFQPDQEGQTYFEAGAETNGAIARSPQHGMSPNNPGTWWLRIVRSGDQLTGYYATSDPEQGGTWSPISLSMNIGTIMPPDNGPVYAGVYGGNGSAAISVDYVRFVPDEDCPEPEPNNPPEIESLSADPAEGEAPLEVAFDVEATDPDGDELTYEWDFGDGSPTSDEEDPTHTYTEPGTYEAVVTVSDGTDEVTDSVTVQVTEPAEPPAGEPLLLVRVKPKSRAVGKRAKRAAFNVTLHNVGAIPAGDVRVCARAKKKRLAVKGDACRTVSIGADQSHAEKFTLRIKRAARGKKNKVRFVVTGAAIERQVQVVTLRVKR